MLYHATSSLNSAAHLEQPGSTLHVVGHMYSSMQGCAVRCMHVSSRASSNNLRLGLQSVCLTSGSTQGTCRRTVCPSAECHVLGKAHIRRRIAHHSSASSATLADLTTASKCSCSCTNCTLSPNSLGPTLMVSFSTDCTSPPSRSEVSND